MYSYIKDKKKKEDCKKKKKDIRHEDYKKTII